MFSPDVVPSLLASMKVEDADSTKGSNSGGSGGASSSDDMMMLDPQEGKKSLEEAKKRKRSYEFNCHFQDNWAQKLPWAKPVIGEDGSMTQVKCTICSTQTR